MSKRSVAVTISGQQYRIRSDEDEEILQRAAGAVDAMMGRIRERTGTVDSHDVAVLTALNLSHELLLQRRRGRAGEELGRSAQDRIEELAEKAEDALASLSSPEELADVASGRDAAIPSA